MKDRGPPVFARTTMFEPERSDVWTWGDDWYEGLKRSLGMCRFWIVPMARTANAVYVGRMEDRWK